MKKTRTYLVRLLLILSGLTVGLLLAEGALRLYNPLPVRVTGHDVRLFKNYQRTLVLGAEGQARGLDSAITYRTNSLGFRGPDPPADFADHRTLITVGGSTTECALLDDQQTWPHVLGTLLARDVDRIWVNNAGIDGCSTFGHDLLLREHLIPLQPDVIVYLVGINDLYQGLYHTSDGFLQTGREYRLRTWAARSEVFALLLNLYRAYKTVRLDLGHRLAGDTPPLSAEALKERKVRHTRYQPEYQARLEALVERTLAHGITPVLVTQPVAPGAKTKQCAGIDLYNQTTLEVGLAHHLLTIDLAATLPPDPAYYYDDVHFTNAGARAVAEQLYEPLRDWLGQNVLVN